MQNQNGQIEINTDDDAIADRPDKPDKSKQPSKKRLFLISLMTKKSCWSSENTRLL
jgi:hypothetical protein